MTDLEIVSAFLLFACLTIAYLLIGRRVDRIHLKTQKEINQSLRGRIATMERRIGQLQRRCDLEDDLDGMLRKAWSEGCAVRTGADVLDAEILD